MAIIYTDQIMGSGDCIINNTPAATYASLNDLATILDNIASGEIPSGSGQPFPVNWNDTTHVDPPWYPDGPNGSDPWIKY